MLSRFSKSPWLGAAVAIAAIIWEVFWLIGPAPHSADDQWAYLQWGLLALAIGCFQAFFFLKRENNRLKGTAEAKRRIGRLQVELASCERAAYSGADRGEYDALYKRIEGVQAEVGAIAVECLDDSFASRFSAVNVYDVQLDEATRMNFMSRAQGSFWTMYQQIKGWRLLLEKIIGELNSR